MLPVIVNRHPPLTVMIGDEMRLVADPSATSLTIGDGAEVLGHQQRNRLKDTAAFFIRLTGLNHFTFMRPKSMRTWRRSARFESSTTGPQGPRQNTTPCQNVRSRSLCHLTASSARSGRASHEAKGTSVLADRIPYSLSSLRTWCALDHNLESSAKMPSRFATRCACR